MKFTPVQRHHLTTVDSTNTWAKQRADTFDREGITLITADQQTAGRGRQKRAWVSPAGVNIYATFCFFLPELRRDIGNLAQVLALSATEVLRASGLRPSIQWPNDIVVDEKKIGGVLCETTPVDNCISVVIGIGLNVNMSAEDLGKVDRPATSMRNETGKEFDKALVLQQLEKTFVRDLQVFLAGGFTAFFEKFNELLTLKKGKSLKINDFQKTHEGTFHSINPDGSVNVLLPSNEIRTFLAGEIL